MVRGKRVLSIDIETYSGIDLAKCGVYAYSHSKAFEILLFGYAFDEEEVKVVDLKNGEALPQEVKEALTDPAVLKTAYNANFERTSLGAYFNINMTPEQWSCTQVLCLSLGLPSSLEETAKALKLKEQKLTEGKKLIKYFSTPKENINFLEENTENWEKFKSYCKRDVEVERAIRKKLERYEINPKEQKLWALDQHINDFGIKVDKELIEKAIACDLKHSSSLRAEFIRLTGIKNPNSTAQIKNWLLNKEGIIVESLCKEKVCELLEKKISEDTKRVLKLRQELSKTSIKKYEAMKRALCEDNCIRGILKFYGANRTGRWAGKLVQVHNLPQNKLKDINLARELLKEGGYESLELLFHSTPEVLSQLIRTAFIPREGSRFIVADFSAIEARVIAWLAGEKWRMEVFKSHGRIYEASAAEMFRVPIEEITKDSPLRQKGKIAELALGYQGSAGALINMGAIKMGLKEEELSELVKAWRNSNPNIVRLWQEVEKAAIIAVKYGQKAKIGHNIEFYFEEGIFFIKLPSGRRLSYINARTEIDERFSKTVITYEGIDQTNKQWIRLKTYGGKLVENIVQAIARDCLGEALLRLSEAGYSIVMHVHDEVVLEVPYGFGTVEEVLNIMAEPLAWAKGLHLTAEAFETGYYKK
jgi:DNA polymerase bacteriophage-type